MRDIRGSKRFSATPYDDGIVFPEQLEEDFATGLAAASGGHVLRLEWISGEETESV